MMVSIPVFTDSCSVASSLAGEYSAMFGIEQDWQADYWAEVLSGRGSLSFTADTRKGDPNLRTSK